MPICLNIQGRWRPLVIPPSPGVRTIHTPPLMCPGDEPQQWGVWWQWAWLPQWRWVSGGVKHV